MRNDYYTYAYLREDGTPYYIGLGCGRRAYKNHRHVPVPPRSQILFLKRNLTRAEAVKHEVYLICVLGRKCDGGILVNLTTGGDGTVGYSVDQNTRDKIRKTLETTHATRGTHWWVNHHEKKEGQFHTCPGEGWERGRLPRPKHWKSPGKPNESHWNSRLTNEERLEIARTYSPGNNGNCSELSLKYGVTMGQIRRIAKDPRWTS
jgi:hypothetical protein